MIVLARRPFCCSKYCRTTTSLLAALVSSSATPVSLLFAASRLGLDPTTNRFHAPIVHHEDYSFHDWPEKHTFPMDKFSSIAMALTTTCKQTHENSPLPRPLVRNARNFFRPVDDTDTIAAWLRSGPIDVSFVNRFLTGSLTQEECRAVGFREQTDRAPLIRRTLLEVAGTILTSQLALQYGLASHTAGGTHHAHPTGGAGYTIFNDVAVATHLLPVTKVLVIDCDVHQGDGTAKFSNYFGDKLATLSVHCGSNYPHPKATSTIDVALDDGIGDAEYLQALENTVPQGLNTIKPDFVFYNAGVDIYKEDRLGRLCVTEAGIRKRDRYVLDQCVLRNIPVAAVVGGGYDTDVDALGRRHAIVHEECGLVWRKHKMWHSESVCDKLSYS